MATLIDVDGEIIHPEPDILFRANLFAECIENERRREECRLALWTLLMFPNEYVAYIQGWRKKKTEAVRELIDYGPDQHSVLEGVEKWREEDFLLRGDTTVLLQQQTGDLHAIASLYQS